jgi:CDP-diacylglycerol--glycerol-3-phosphate 3-phosphatidyltransferase
VRAAVLPLTLPNVLTLARILLVPVLVVALLDETPNGDLVAAVVFAVASATDAVDGWLARRSRSITTFGKLMDPVADKLLVVAALVALVSLERLAAWVAMVIIARELAVTVARAQASASGIVLASNWWGKAKTIVQVPAILLVIAFDPTPVWVDAAVYVAVAITVASGADFFFGLRGRVRAQRRQCRSRPSSHSRMEV